MTISLLNVWRWVKWPLIILAVAYVLLVIWRMTVLYAEEETELDVARIHQERLTWADVNTLPPAPDTAQNDKTLAGVDANNNGIRDDVEIEIYNKYKGDQKTIVAMLQYAKALQKEFTEVYNSPTLVAVIQEEDRGYSCIGEIKLGDFVDELVFNTEDRKRFQENLYEKYMTSYALPNENYCDIAI